MRITFLLRSLTSKFSSLGLVVLSHGMQLQSFGHSVTIVVPADRGSSIQRKPILSQLRLSYETRKLWILLRGGRVLLKCPWLKVQPELNIIEVPDLHERHIPDGDVVIASSVWMLDALADYSSAKGKKFYLIQGYDLDDSQNTSRYRSPIKKIVISAWLKNAIENVMPDQQVYEVLNGVDVTVFNAKGRSYNLPPKRIGMVYYYKAPASIKGVPDGIEAFEIAKREYPHLELVMFGTRKDGGVPVYSEFHPNPTRRHIADIYRSCDIFLFPSRQEAGGLPPMEAMACGCALVTTNVGGVSEYTIPGKTALVSLPSHPETLALNLVRLIKDPEEFSRIAKEGNQFIQNFSWEKMSRRLEEILIHTP